MTKEERQELIKELRKLHETIIPAGGYYCAKFPHLHDGGDVKVIGLYPSEISKGDDVYVEMVKMDYTPLDSSRRLYVWKHRKDCATIYELNEKTGQYLVPVSDLSVVTGSKTESLVDKMKPLQHEQNLKTEAYNKEMTAPTFEMKETSERHYKEEVYESQDGSMHKVEFKNGVPSEYQFRPKDKPLGHGFILQGEHLTEVFNFIKQLKY